MLYISDYLLEEKGNDFFNDYRLDDLKSKYRGENTVFEDMYLNRDDMYNYYISKYPISYDEDYDENSYEAVDLLD